MRYALFAVLSILIFLFVSLVFRKDDNLPERLDQIENSALDTLLKGSDPQKQKSRKKGISFRHIPKSVQTAVRDSGIPLRVDEYFLIWITAAILPAILVFTFSSNLITALLTAVAGAILPPTFLKMQKKRRLSTFGTQLGDALLMIANGLRAGFSFEQVLETVARDMPDPISSEFARVVMELKMGMSLEDSLTSLTDRMQNTDMRLLTSAVLIQRQVGGNLAEILDGISDTIQDRIQIKKHIGSMTAQGKISGLMVGSIPVFLYVAISAMNPEYMSVFSETTYGKILLLVGIAMETVGFLIIRKMIDLKA